MTTPQLFAKAHGKPVASGGIRCALCYGSCATGSPVADVLSDSFTDFARVRGDTLCDGCMMTLRAENREDQPRLYSWVLTDLSAKRYTKANLTELSTACLNPPEPPYAIVLAMSGQKHLLFKSSPCFDPVMAAIDLEGERVEYLPADLSNRITLCKRIAVACGKPTLSEYNPASMSIQLSNYWQEWQSLADQWKSVRGEPLSRLATFLTPGKDALKDEYPSDIESSTPAAKAGRAVIPPKTGGTGGPGLFD